MAKYAIEVTPPKKYYVLQEKEFTPHSNDTITVTLYCYKSEEDAKENDKKKRIEEPKTFNLPQHGQEKINEATYIEKCCECLGGTEIVFDSEEA